MIRDFSDFSDLDLINQLVIKAKLIEAAHYSKNQEKEKEVQKLNAELEFCKNELIRRLNVQKGGKK